MICTVCPKKAERHHIKTRGSGGSDHPDNIMPLCREHHTEIHKSRNKFVEKYHLEDFLTEKGWEYMAILKKWLPPKTAVRSYDEV